MTDTSSVIDRISAYAGKSMDKDRPRNPNITAREAIDLANYIEHLRAEVTALRLAADEVLSWNLNDTSALLSNPPQNAALFHAQRVLRAARAALDARRKEK